MSADEKGPEGPALTVKMWADGVVQVESHRLVSKGVAAALIEIGTAMQAEAAAEAATS